MAAAMLRHFFPKAMYVASVGILKGHHDPFVDIVMDEIGIDMKKHRPMTFDELEELEGLNFDLVISLAPEAHHHAVDLTRSLSVETEYWPTPDPDTTIENREQRLVAYRAVRDLLLDRIKARFLDPPPP